MTGRRRVARAARAWSGGDGGFTLIELLVTVALFSIVLAVFGAGMSVMFKDLRHQLGQSDDLDAGRRVLAQLDKQVRYANAIDTPGTTGSAGSLTWWVEWRSGDPGAQQSCTQWRIQPTGEMQYRSWQLAVGGGISGQTAWSTRARNISQPVTSAAGATPVVLGDPFAIPPASVRAATRRQQLVVGFVSTYGKPAVTTPSQVTLTAQNTTSSEPPASAVCGGQRL